MQTSATMQTSDNQRQMRRAWDHYNGTPKNPLVMRTGEPDDNLIISLARLIVDKGASFLFGQDVQSQITEPGQEMKQDWLNECWRRNRRALTLQKLATNGGIFGHAFLRLMEQQPYPRVIVIDPSIVEVQTDPQDVEKVWKYIITPPTAAGPETDDPQLQMRTLITTQSGIAGYQVYEEARWTIIDQQFMGGAWVDAERYDWPFPFSPIIDCQNLPKPNDFWGTSDLPEDVLKILDGINRIASHYNKIIRIHAHPKVWSRGMGQRTLDISIDSIVHLPGEDAELKILEMQSDLASTLALLNRLLDLMSMIVRIPLVAMGQPDNLGAISGVALQIRYQPLLEKTESKRLTYGDVVQEADRRLLAMGGFDDMTVTQLVWPNIMPSDPLEERQVAVLDDSLGVVSKETLAEQFGYDWDQEQDQITNERQAAIDAGLVPDPTVPPVPPPAALQAPNPDIAKTAKSK